MFKRIMKIAGIVIGVVILFTGAVIGVMAAMGKFKKKKIYPDRLFFAETEQVVIFDEINEPDKWYSFTVMGENSKSKYAVNMNECYISFVNKESSNLIDLYDKNKNKLEANESGRYEIECNTPVYYKIKKQDEVLTGNDFGKVVIHALGEEMSMVASNKDLTIYIDRKVESINVKADELDFEPSSADSPFAKQHAVIATCDRFYFDYESSPAAALYPTERYGKKEVELYYKESLVAPYEKIDEDTDLIKWDSNLGKYYFTSYDVATGYDFYIATFATYQDKIDYYAMLEANPDDEHSIKERLDHMVVTNLKISTYSVGIKQVSMGVESISFDLRNDNILTLNEDVSGETNLRLSMTDSDNKLSTVRFNSIEFMDNSIFGTAVAHLVDRSDENNIRSIDLEGATTVDAMVGSDKVWVGSTAYTINDIKDADGYSISMYGKCLVCLIDDTTGKEYVCSNGYLLHDDGENKLYLLSVGTYLGLFEKNDIDKEYTLLDVNNEDDKAKLDYSAQKVPAFIGRWNLQINNYDETAQISLLCLVVNSIDSHKYGDVVFATKNVEIEEIGLSFGQNSSFNNCVVENTLTLRVPSTNQETKSFADIVNIDESVSYDQCVFVTKFDEYNKYEISTINKTFTIGSGADAKTYVLVGYEEGGKFVNAVKAIKQIDGVETKIYVMQLKNTDISNIASTGLQSHEIKKDNPINVDVLFKPSEISFAIEDKDETKDGIQLYEKQTGYTLTIGGDDATNLVDAGLKAENFKVYLNDSSTESDKINNLSWDEANKKLTFNTNGVLDNSTNRVCIAIVFNGATIKSDPIEIISIKPTSVKYGGYELYVGDDYEEEDKYDKEIYTITLGYDSGIKATGYLLGTQTSAITLNKHKSINGFNTNKDVVEQEFIYRSLNEDVFSVVDADAVDDKKEIQANRVGTAYLEVRTVSGYVGYLKVVVSADDGFTLGGKKADGQLESTSFETTGSSYNLKDELAYECNGTSIDSLVEIPNAGSIEIDYFGGGSVSNIEYKSNGLIHEYYYGSKDVDANKILTIENDGGWKFDRPNYKYCDLTIKFNVSVITREADETITLNFSPATKINFNSEWNDQQIYNETKILLVEESVDGTFSDKPYYKITNPNKNTESITITSIKLGATTKYNSESSIAGQDNIYKNNIFTPDERGKYIITFSNSETRELYVVDNVIAKLIDDEFVSENEAATFITLYSFDTSVVYGNIGVGIYPLSSATTSVGLDEKVAIKGATDIFKYDSKFYTEKITNLNIESVQEKIELTYNVNKLVIYDLDGNKIDFVNVTVNNKYTVTETTAKMFVTAFTEKTLTDMLTITGGTLTLSSVAIDEIDAGNISTGDSEFTINKAITDYITKEIKFTYIYEEVEYTYTTNVELRPYLPEKNNEYKIWANTQGNSWKEDFFGSEKSALYAEIDSDKIKGVSVDYPADYDGEKIITFDEDKYIVGAINTTSKTIPLCFKFIYDENGEYSYTDTINVVISNEYTIEANYPYFGLTTNKPLADSFDVYDTEFKNWYTNQSVLSIEPVLVGQTIKLFDDELYQDRIVVEDPSGTPMGKNSIKKVSIAAKSKTIRTYSLETQGHPTAIKFASNGGLGTNKFGYIVLKIVTTTGSYTYYTIQLVNSQVTANTTTYSVTASGKKFVDSNKLLEEDILSAITISNLGALDFGKASFYLVGYEGIYKDNNNTELGINFGTKLDSETLSTDIKNYVTLKIAMIYHDNAYFNAGILTIYVTPNGAPSVDTTLTEVISGYQNGYYTATINRILGKIENPFNDSAKAELVEDFDFISIVDDDDFTITKYVSDDTTFTVKYCDSSDNTKNIRYVTYTLTAFGHSSITSNMNVTTGNLVGTTFNNIVKLTDLIGSDYQGKIAITNDDDEDYELVVSSTPSTDPSTIETLTIGGKIVVLKYDATNKYYFEFTQEQKQYSLNFTIKYLDICNPNIPTDSFARAVTVTVKSDIDMSVATGSLGSSVSNPLLTTIGENPYATEYPSFITIEKTTSSDVDKYTIFNGTNVSDGQTSGFTLYVKSGATLEISFDNWSYVGIYDSDESKYVKITSSQAVSDDYKFYFTHASANRPLTMTIKVKDSSGNYYCEGSGNDHLTATLNLNVQRTYTDLVVNYEVNGANHEVIENCADTTPDTKSLQTESGFFANLTSSGAEIGTSPANQIKNTNRFTLMKGGTQLSDSTKSVYTLLKDMGFFTEGNPNKLSYVNGDGYTLSGSTLTFDKTTSQKSVNFVFSSHELGDKSYKFNLLPGKNGLIQTADIINGKQVTFGTNYASILVNDTVDDKNTSKDLLSANGSNDGYVSLARIADNQTSSIYYISSMSLDGTSVSPANIVISPIASGKIYTIKDTTNKFDFYIRLVDGELQVKLFGQSGRTLFNTRVYKFTLYGDGLVETDFEIVFANYNISFIEGETIDGDSIINLNEKIDIIQNSNGNEISLDSAIMKSGTYKESSVGQTYDIRELASWDNGNKMLTLRLLAGTIRADIQFEIFVKVGDDYYSVGTYTYSFSAERNFNFKINGVTIKDNSVETDYLLTASKISDKYKDVYSSGGSSTVNYTIAGVTKQYSTDLKLQMAVTQGDGEKIVSNDEMNGYISVVVPDEFEDYIEFKEDGSCIIFNNDYYDKDQPIPLTINVDLTAFGRGSYTFTWYIRPVGFVNMVPKGEAVLGNSSTGFESGTYVDLLSSSSTESRGIQFFNTSTINSTISITGITVSSKINDINTGVESSQSTVTLYNAVNDLLSTNDAKTYLLANNALKVKLPLVEQSSSPSATHHVTYTVAITYSVGHDDNILTWSQTYDVAYGVYNPQAISTNSNADKVIDVDNSNKTYVVTKSGNTITAGDILIFSTATIPDTEPMFNVATSEQLSWADIEDMYVRFAISADSDKTGTVFSGGREYVYFKLVSTNGNYIPSTGKFDKDTPENDSDDVDSTTYTIDITEPYSNDGCTNLLTLGTGEGKSGTLFKNFLNADLDVMSAGQVVTGIKAYKDELNPGFRLETSNEIKTKGEVAGETYRFIDIFKDTSYFDSNASKLMNEMVLGFSSDGKLMKKWINGEPDNSTESINTSNRGTITITLIDGAKTQFTISSSVYTKTGTDLYSLSRTFYTIGSAKTISSDGDEATISSWNAIYAPNITATQSVTFTESSTGDYVFDGERFVKYQMSTYLEKVEIDQNADDADDRIGINSSYQIVGDETNYTAHESEDFTNAVSIVGGKIYISKAFLQAYKNMHQDKTSITLKFNTTTDPKIEFNIQLALPKTASLVATAPSGFTKTESVVDGVNTITFTKNNASSGLNDINILEILNANAYFGNSTITLNSPTIINSANVANIKILSGSSYVQRYNDIELSESNFNVHKDNLYILENDEYKKVNYANFTDVDSTKKHYIQNFDDITLTNATFATYKNNLYTYNNSGKLARVPYASFSDVDSTKTHYIPKFLIKATSDDKLPGNSSVEDYFESGAGNQVVIQLEITYYLNGESKYAITNRLEFIFNK